MELRLKYEPLPQNAPRFAADIVASAWDVDKVGLDYSPMSVQLVDEIIEGFRAEGLHPEQIGETLFGFGCYVGEVLARNAGGTWRSAADTPMRDYSGAPFVVELPGGRFTNPVGKAFKRLENGAEDSLEYFYRTFTLEGPM